MFEVRLTCYTKDTEEVDGQDRILDVKGLVFKHGLLMDEQTLTLKR